MNARTKTRAWAVAAAASFVLMITINGLANALPLNGVSTGQLSDEIPNLFVPAGLTFAIWGVIYLLLLGYVAAALRESFSSSGGERWDGVDGALVLGRGALSSGLVVIWAYAGIILKRSAADPSATAPIIAAAYACIAALLAAMALRLYLARKAAA